MNHLQNLIWSQLQPFYVFINSKDPDWKDYKHKFDLQMIKNVVALFFFTLALGYVLAGKGFQSAFVVLVAATLMLTSMNDNTTKVMSFFTVLLGIGIPWLRLFLLGKETLLYNHIYSSVTILPIMLFTKSFLLTCLSFIYILIFNKLSGEYILDLYETSPADFYQPLHYLIDHTNIISILFLGFVVLLVYQNQLIIFQLWSRQKEREALLQQLEKQNQALHDLHQSKTKLLLGFSHEFRNPINAALGNIELANEKVKDPVVKDHLINCKASIETLFHLVSNLLDSTKLEAGILEVNPIQKSSKVMFFKIWEIIKSLLDKQGLIGEFYVHRKIPKMLKVDSHFVVKILLNLLLNAVKYTTRGTIMTVVTWIDQEEISESMLQPSKTFLSKFLSAKTQQARSFDHLNPMMEIESPTFRPIRPRGSSFNSSAETEIPSENTLHVEKTIFEHQMACQPSIKDMEKLHIIDREYEKLTNKPGAQQIFDQKDFINADKGYRQRGLIKVEVYDSGIGIEQNILQNSLFSKFSSQKSEERLGLGLGLWLIKGLCEIMKGQISAHSEKNQGSQFVAVLPVEVPDIRKPTGGPNPFSPLYKVPKKVTALVVDDDKYNREINVTFLTKAGIKVKGEAVNGEEAVKIFTSKPPNYFDLIMMDLEMPVMNGKEAMRRIRTFEKLHNRIPTKVVIATGNCDLAEYSACMDSDGDIRADFFYRKPLFHKDFEEFAEVVQKEKVKQASCLVIGGDVMVIEFLETFVKKQKVHVIPVDSIEEADRVVREGVVNLKWVLVHTEIKKEGFKDLIQQVETINVEENPVSIIGFGEGILSEKRKSWERIGVSKVIQLPIKKEDLKEIFCVDM